MIDEDITYNEKGYRSTDLSKGSHKKVWRICDGCGGGGWFAFKDVRAICKKCYNKAPAFQRCKNPVDKLPWVDDDITFAEKGYRSTDLKPSSCKEVWRICEMCGEGRWIIFEQCGSLCRKCFHKDGNHRRNLSACHADYSGKNHPGYGKKLSPEWRANISKNHADVSGENNPNWKGGIAFAPYCSKFNNVFKEAIRNRFGRLCFMCFMTEEKNGRKLCVHHVSYDKDCMCNGKECEFVPVCNKCHSRTNHNDEVWERLIINVLQYEGWI